jgi:hypothetical protein
MQYSKPVGLMLILAWAGTQTGCSGVPSSGTNAVSGDEVTVQATSEALSTWENFTPPRGLSVSTFVSYHPKIARAPSWNNYEWDSNGSPFTASPFTSRGGNSLGTLNPGDYQLGNLAGPFTASMPFDDSYIAGIGIAQNTSHVYVWYTNNVVSEGTSTNFLAYSLHTNPWTGPTSLGNLIDADISPNGQVYYYWWLNGIVQRSIGTSTYGGAANSLQSVTMTPGKTLFSVSFLPSGSIEAWFTDGSAIVSGNSLYFDGEG